MGTAAAAAIGIVGAGVSTAVSIKKMKDSKKMQEMALKEIRDFEYQDLNTLQVSTAMEDVMRTESARQYATAVDSLRESGGRAQAAVLPKLAAKQTTLDAKLYAGLDAKQKELDKMKVGIQEKRSNDQIAGYGQMLNVANQDKAQGMTDMVNSLGNMGEQGSLLFSEDGLGKLFPE